MYSLCRHLVGPPPEPLETDTLVGQFFKPSRYLPFSKNKNFIGRADEMNEFERKLFIEQDCQKIAVVGLGGVGKTQVALQFAHSVLEKHADVSIFWMHALSSETFEQACREVAVVIGLVSKENDKEDVKELIQRHLSAERAGRWMLIVDNADDMDVLEGSDGEKGILDYLPKRVGLDGVYDAGQTDGRRTCKQQYRGCGKAGPCDGITLVQDYVDAKRSRVRRDAHR
jgi:hypothetical protein